MFCTHRGVAQLGRALRSGRRGRVFKSRHPDHHNPLVPKASGFFIDFSRLSGVCEYREYRDSFKITSHRKESKYLSMHNLGVKKV